MSRRALVLGWHAWGYWVLTVALAAAAPMSWMALAILAVYVAFWLFGVVRAVVQRDSTLVARCVGFVVFALAWLTLLMPDDPERIFSFLDLPESWGGRLGLAFALAFTLAGIFFIGLIHAGLRWRVYGARAARSSRAWQWPSVGFPLSVFVGMLLLQFVWWAPWLALVVFAVVWLCGLVWAREVGERLRPRWIGLGAAACLLAGWPPISVDANRDAIAEVVLRRELVGSRSTSFLRIEGGDPSVGLLRRLSELGRRIKPSSAAGSNSNGWVIDPETGKTATTCWITSIRRSWLSPCAVEVRVGSAGGPLCGAGYTYWVAWCFGRWVVVSERMDWIS